MSDIEKVIAKIQNDYKVGIDYSSGKDDTAICILGSQAEKVMQALKKVKEYEDLEEQGRLIKLPCPLKTEVWCTENIWDEETPISMEFDYWEIPFWGETCFLTYEEAVAKLKEAKGE